MHFEGKKHQVDFYDAICRGRDPSSDGTDNWTD